MDLKKYLMAGGLSLVLVLGACGGGGSEEDSSGDSADDTSTEETTTEDSSGDEASDDSSASSGDVDAEGIAQSSCASCHGADFSGGMGPALAGTSLSEDEFNDIVRNGQNSMPAFSEDQINDEELSALYSFFTE